MSGRHTEQSLMPPEDVASARWAPVAPTRWCPVDRRAWLRLAAAAGAALGGFGPSPRLAVAADEPKAPRADDDDPEIKAAEAAARKATSQPLLRLRSRHYLAIGDASERFIKLTLADCEQTALDFLK